MSVAPRIKAAFALAALTVLGYVAIGELTPTADREIVTDHGTYPTHLRIGEAPAGASGATITINIGTYVGSAEELSRMLAKELRLAGAF